MDKTWEKLWYVYEFSARDYYRNVSVDLLDRRRWLKDKDSPPFSQEEDEIDAAIHVMMKVHDSYYPTAYRWHEHIAYDIYHDSQYYLFIYKGMTWAVAPFEMPWLRSAAGFTRAMKATTKYGRVVAMDGHAVEGR
jgi:hypothetical protein